MQKTEKLNMNLFESGDPVKAEFFNHNTQVLEDAVTNKVGYAAGGFDWLDLDESVTLTFDRKPLLLIFLSSFGLGICARDSYGVSVSSNDSTGNKIRCQWGDTDAVVSMTSPTAVLGGGSRVSYFAILE